MQKWELGRGLRCWEAKVHLALNLNAVSNEKNIK